MPKSRATIDDAVSRAKLDRLAAGVRREAGDAEADPFDNAMVAAVAGLAETMAAETGVLAELEARFGKLVRRALEPE